MTVIDAYRTSLYSDDSLFVKDCNAWVTPVISEDSPTFIAYVEDTDTKKYSWHRFLYKRNEDGTWNRKKLTKATYSFLYKRWVCNPQEIRH